MANPFETLLVKNRTDETIEVQFDSIPISFAPHEEKHLAAHIARHCETRSMLKLNPLTGEFSARLVVVDAETPYPGDVSGEAAHPVEVLDRDVMPATNFDPISGEPLKAEVKQIAGDPRDYHGRAPLPARKSWDQGIDKASDEAFDKLNAA